MQCGKCIGPQTSRAFIFLPVKTDGIIPVATDAVVSVISNRRNCSSDFTDYVLKTYFRVPRYLRNGDIFVADIKKYAPDYFYASSNDYPRRVYFKVKALKIPHGSSTKTATARGCYVIKGETNLSQLPNIFAKIPSEYLENIKLESRLPIRLRTEISLLPNCPPFLEQTLSSLLACVAPFLQNGSEIKIRPFFLIKGPPGSGKYKLVECLAKRKGLNFQSIDFSDIQCLSAAQTEAKIRIVFDNARACVPCVLRLSNIQIFGKNAEGKKDERIISTFVTELEKLMNDTRKLEHPVIVIATVENDEIETDIERLFIETIHLKHPDKAERAEALSWFIKTKGLSYHGNLVTIAGSVPDFELADLETLVTHAAKIAYRSSSTSITEHGLPLSLTDDDLAKACDLMQNSFADRIGAPQIPKVYWEDIGGLAKLKHEIKRRIELSLLNTMGLGKSGILLYGPPGTGKTLLAKAVATECQLHFMSVKGPELLNMYVGQSEKNVRQVFERARAAAPCVIFFDELDSLAPSRGRSGDSGGVMDRVVSQLLAEMDGLESSGTVFIIGATNRLDLIDPALLRPGRFDKMLYVGIYDDRDSQLSVMRAVTRRFRMNDRESALSKIVKKLPKNLTGADLYAVCSDAWLGAVRRNFTDLDSVKDENVKNEMLRRSRENGILVEAEDFYEAARSLVPSLSASDLAHYKKLETEFSSARKQLPVIQRRKGWATKREEREYYNMRWQKEK